MKQFALIALMKREKNLCTQLYFLRVVNTNLDLFDVSGRMVMPYHHGVNFFNLQGGNEFK